MKVRVLDFRVRVRVSVPRELSNQIWLLFLFLAAPSHIIVIIVVISS